MFFYGELDKMIKLIGICLLLATATEMEHERSRKPDYSYTIAPMKLAQTGKQSKKTLRILPTKWRMWKKSLKAPN
jgi:hypothetical protein